jgi:hypothetical protein
MRDAVVTSFFQYLSNNHFFGSMTRCTINLTIHLHIEISSIILQLVLVLLDEHSSFSLDDFRSEAFDFDKVIACHGACFSVGIPNRG